MSTPRVYGFRNKGKSTKYFANSCESPKTSTTSCDTYEITKCNNCTALSRDNDRLRRQIAILRSFIDKHSIGIDPIVPDCSRRDNLLEPLPRVLSTQTQTPNIVLESKSCGSDECLALNTEAVTYSSKACDTNDTSQLIISADGNNHIIWPYYQLDRNVFGKFDILHLEQDTTFTHTFNNRSVAYYGSQTYSYAGSSHPPRAILDNKYLVNILDVVKEQYPDYQFNSAMITRYANGEEWMPFHSDDEARIAPHSSIMTISFGETRSLQFQSKVTPHTHNAKLSLEHGDVLLMSQQSQSYFQHGIPKDTASKLPRISITLRLLKEVSYSDGCKHDSSQYIPPAVNRSQCIPPALNRSQCIPPTVNHMQNKHASEKATISDSSHHESIKKTDRKRVVYISSSMFKSLNESKLSSKFHDALVFSYSGATVKSMEEQFKEDQRVSDIDSKTVQTIVLMCGTNNIDNIIDSPKFMRDKFISEQRPHSCSMEAITETFKSTEHFLMYLHEWAPNARIKILNILPRESRARNQVISRINSYFCSLAQKYSFIEHPDSMFNRSYLFANKAGFRKSVFFSSRGSDNVHLNKKGIIRFAKYLKYIGHND